MTVTQLSKLIETLTLTLGTTPERVIKAYKLQVVAAGLSYTLLGLAILAVGCWVSPTHPWVLLISTLVGGVFISENVGDVVSPEAAAMTKILDLLGDLVDSEGD